MPVAAQVNKCEGPDSPVYQQAPCEGEGDAIRSISVTPGLSPEQRQAMERQRVERQQAASDRRQKRIDDTYGELRRIQQENADPEMCQEARGHLFMLMNRGEPEYSTALFTAREQVKLYCNP
jgi:hypothetical protein